MKNKNINKFQRDLKKVSNTFGDVNKTVRTDQTRRDTDNTKTPNVGLFEIDRSIKWFFDNRIKPHVVYDGESVRVPVMYAAPEKWVSIQSQGYVRDDKGKIMTPLITYMKTSIDPRTDLPSRGVLDDPTNKLGGKYLMKQKHTQQNRYDQFSILTGQKPAEQYYEISVPEYVNVNYQVLIWCDYTKHVNSIIEQIIFWQGMAWGDRYKFIALGQAYDFETVNANGEDRIVKATCTLKVQAHIVPEFAGTEPNMKKQITPVKIVWGQTPVVDINEIQSNYSGSL